MKEYPEERNIVLFDGICNLCNALVRFIIKRDHEKKFLFTPIQSGSAQNILSRYPKIPPGINAVVYLKGQRYYTRSSAILHILKDLGGGAGLIYGLVIIPPSIRDFIYKIIASKRYRIFGKLDSCMIPEPDISDRFI